jgi:hypothetical protein
LIPRTFEATKREAFIKELGEDELLYLNRLIVERLKLIAQEKSTRAMGRFNTDAGEEWNVSWGYLRERESDVR